MHGMPAICGIAGRLILNVGLPLGIMTARTSVSPRAEFRAMPPPSQAGPIDTVPPDTANQTELSVI